MLNSPLVFGLENLLTGIDVDIGGTVLPGGAAELEGGAVLPGDWKVFMEDFGPKWIDIKSLSITYSITNKITLNNTKFNICIPNFKKSNE